LTTSIAVIEPSWAKKREKEKEKRESKSLNLTAVIDPGQRA
jgi:hypothetical protein